MTYDDNVDTNGGRRPGRVGGPGGSHSLSPIGASRSYTVSSRRTRTSGSKPPGASPPCSGPMHR